MVSYMMECVSVSKKHRNFTFYPVKIAKNTYAPDLKE